MNEIEQLFSNELTKLTKEQLNQLIEIRTLHMDDIVLQMFTKTTEKLREKNDNELTGIFEELIKLEDDDKSLTIEKQIKHEAINRVTSNVAKDKVIKSVDERKTDVTKPNDIEEQIKDAAINSVTSNVEIVSKIEKSAQDKVIESVNERKTDVTETNDIEEQVKDAAINSVTSNVDIVSKIEKSEKDMHMLEINIIEKKIKDAAIDKVNNYILENNYVNNYPRKQVGIVNNYNDGKVICYANSVLQMLYSLPYYRTIISRGDSYDTFINELFKNMNNTHDNFVIPTKIDDCPSNVYNFVIKTHNSITVIQEDAYQYLNYCLDILPNYAIDAVNFKEFTKRQCNNEKDTTKDENLSNLSIPVSVSSTINGCIETYSNEVKILDETLIKNRKTGIKTLMLKNLNQTISELRNMIPENDERVMANSLINNIKSSYNDSAKIIDLLHIKNSDNTIFLLREPFERYITFNKVLYNILNTIESKDETEFIDGCIKYPESMESNESFEHFESIEDFEKYIKENDDYLVVIKKIIKEFRITSENRYLFIQLNRFQQNKDGTINKLTDIVVPDKTLTIGGVRYTLSGVICHIGPYDNGHYIYIQCNQNGEYVILYDDEKVYDYAANAPRKKYHMSSGSSINEDFINKNGYLFSYSRYPIDQNVKKTPAKQTNADALVKKKQQEDANAAALVKNKPQEEATAAALVKKKQDEVRKNVEKEAMETVKEEVDNLEKKILDKKLADATKEGNKLLSVLKGQTKSNNTLLQAHALDKKKQEEADADALAKKKQEEADADALAKKQKEDADALAKKQEEEAVEKAVEKVLEKAVEKQADCKKSHYECLGVKNNATEKEIKTAYRKLALQFHPDKHTDNNVKNAMTPTIQQINDAYNILSDPIKKKSYDKAEEEARKKAAKEARKKAEEEEATQKKAAEKNPSLLGKLAKYVSRFTKKIRKNK